MALLFSRLIGLNSTYFLQANGLDWNDGPELRTSRSKKRKIKFTFYVRLVNGKPTSTRTQQYCRCRIILWRIWKETSLHGHWLHFYLIFLPIYIEIVLAGFFVANLIRSIELTSDWCEWVQIAYEFKHRENAYGSFIKLHGVNNKLNIKLKWYEHNKNDWHKTRENIERNVLNRNFYR